MKVIEILIYLKYSYRYQDASTSGRLRLPAREATTVLDGRASGEDRPPSIDTTTEHQCTICLDLLYHRTTMHLPCVNAFHPECIGSWLNESRTCPMCRRNVLALEEILARHGVYNFANYFRYPFLNR
ncbi:hypothetical protein AVEN_223143-1 [Araneus ventricosus]|uniref:RING-type domain-containing protein n=1 Tax=Araneus ventricosus TaxID=182803 RepID=A0A4Y2UDU2_ARAVE|nr:hypothetical protein AVEN_114047-1 [Araneus ventricosus]GBO10917.1 hypothetical protein AVEN_223143-1 [Araneus ventricosus]